MKALNFITAAVAFVATLTMVGCGDSQDELKARQGLVLVKFEPKDELDKVALATAQEKYPDKTFYRYVRKTINYTKKAYTDPEIDATKGQEGLTNSRGEFVDGYDFEYRLVFEREKDKFVGYNMLCSSEKKQCKFEKEFKIN